MLGPPAGFQVAVRSGRGTGRRAGSTNRRGSAARRRAAAPTPRAVPACRRARVRAAAPASAAPSREQAALAAVPLRRLRAPPPCAACPSCAPASWRASLPPGRPRPSSPRTSPTSRRSAAPSTPPGLARRPGRGRRTGPAMGHDRELVVDLQRLLAGLAFLADAHDAAALLAQPCHQRCEVGVRRSDGHHVGPLGQHQVNRVHGQGDVGGILARAQVDHGLDRKPPEDRLVLERTLGRAIGAAHVQRTMCLQQVRHRLLDDVDRHVVGIDEQHHAVGGHASFQFRVSPPRSGLMSVSPKGSVSGSVQARRCSVTLPVLRGRP